MYIARVKLENFKQHKSLEREFTRGVNAIFGPNGAGKTSIILNGGSGGNVNQGTSLAKGVNGIDVLNNPDDYFINNYLCRCKS